jgi:hypothetical protein
MDIGKILEHPLAVPIIAFLGVILGAILKGVFDIWSNERTRRQDLEKHVMEQIEKAADSYYLMSNYAYVLSYLLYAYIETKRELQMLPLDQASTPTLDEKSLYESDLENRARDIGRDALFYAGKLYAVITERLWVKGGRYFLPDKWANQAIVDLHNNLMQVLGINPTLLLEHIRTDTDLPEFYGKLDTSTVGNKKVDNKAKELQDAYHQYQEWLLKQDKEVKEAAAEYKKGDFG